MWYDKKGNQINYEQAEKFLTDPNYKFIKQEELSDGKWISTVWLGLDHNFYEKDSPLIFETMVFPKKGDYQDLDCQRYSTEEEAISGHEKLVKKYSN